MCSNKAIITLLIHATSVLLASAQAPSLNWAADIGGKLFAVDALTNSYALQTSGAVVVVNPLGVPMQTNMICPLPGVARRDAAGNFYFGGSFDGTNDFGGITLVGGWINGVNYNPPRWAPGYPTCFLAKYASNGSLQWAVSFGAQAMVNQLSDLALNADGSVMVGFSTPAYGDKLGMFSSNGTNVWTTLIPGSYASFKAVKVGGFNGTNGCFLEYRYDHFLHGGFYDSVGNLSWFTGFPQLTWSDSMSTNGRPVTGINNAAYLAALSSNQPVLQKAFAGGSIAWTQYLGAVEQWVLGGDAQGSLYLAGTDGSFSKYDASGTFIWTTNYGSPAVALEIGAAGDRFVSFLNGSVARLASDPPAEMPTISNGPQAQTIFVGGSVSLSASVGGTPPLRYQWCLNQTNILNATNALYNIGSATAAQGGYYSLVVTNGAGAVTSPPALLRVKSVQLYVGSQMLTNGTYTFATPPTLSIHSAFAGGLAFYALDGSTPSFASTFYTGTISLAHSATVRAIGYSADFSQSEEADLVYAVVLEQQRLAASASGGGTVSLNPAGGSYLSTNVVTATAVPAAGYSFLYWLGDAAGANASVNVSMERAKSIRAVFGTTLATTVAGNGQVLLDPPGGLYPFGTMVRLTALPQAGNYFGFWGNAATGNTNPLYFTISAPTQTVSSIFGAVPGGQAALTVLVNGHGRVNASPRANAYAFNQSVTLTATPDAGQTFINWSGDASGTPNPLTISMTQGKVITANFTARPNLRVDRSGLEGFFPEGFRFTLVSDLQSTCQIVASTNLTAWENIGWVTNIYGEVQFTDPSVTNAPQKFYRSNQ